MERKGDPGNLSGHVVICNANAKVRGIVEELHTASGGGAEAAPEVVVLDPVPELWAVHPDWQPRVGGVGVHTVVGQPANAVDLRRAGIREAKVAVILADPRLGELADARSTLLAMAIERENNHIHTIMELISSVNRVHLRATEINEVVCRGEVAERLIAQSCITPGIKNIYAELLAASARTNQLRLVPVWGAGGERYQDLVRASIEDGRPMTICGFVRIDRDEQGRPVRRVVLNPPDREELGKRTRLRAGQDQLIVVSKADYCSKTSA